MWECEYTTETSASPETIWTLFRDVAGWKAWNADIESIEMQGPFAVGTEFTMVPPGQEPLTTRLVEVRENEGFTDETSVGGVTVTVAHRILRLGPRRSRVVYAMQVVGPGADEIGPVISGDFPEVLAALKDLAESR